ncbi:hypothetical protein E1292_23770 [Nonomuraea deserti]|uniref:Streptomyces killer toxin-like beta/gamma crystallin domain-containing protein n=1 Tax=Nonomuraea deserti TaxID=1848322 RepID=A0A4R4VAD1_9ACTN|nr:beta/gamma crystallin domain-containing protein [Nonomuraea deserti]TDD02299.1 hypothetical protein E1292_23770 [Nonomuraea deserti]
MVAFPAPAFAINHADCNVSHSREVLQIFNGTDHHCFANAGTMSVAIYGVGLISAGNNKVAIEYTDDVGGPAKAMLLPKWNIWEGSPGSNGNMHMVYRIRIV